jgi:hypothetical protein
MALGNASGGPSSLRGALGFESLLEWPSTDVSRIETSTAIYALVAGSTWGHGPPSTQPVVSTWRSKAQGDQAIGPTMAAKEQSSGMVPASGTGRRCGSEPSGLRVADGEGTFHPARRSPSSTRSISPLPNLPVRRRFTPRGCATNPRRSSIPRSELRWAEVLRCCSQCRPGRSCCRPRPRRCLRRRGRATASRRRARRR